jgi:hypothetical protein
MSLRMVSSSRLRMRAIVLSRTLTVRVGSGQRFMMMIAQQLIESSGRESAGV